MLYKGIDVSSYQGVIDWKKVKDAGVQFAILKIIRKNLNPDTQFENNWKGCLEAGVPIQGVYNYSYATTPEKAKSDARKVLEILGSDRHPFIWLDYEDASLPKDSRAADIINAYGDVITAGGCRFGIYFGMSFYSSYLDKIMEKVKSEYRIGWEARYYRGYKGMTLTDAVDEGKCPGHFKGMFLGWQYTSSGVVPGINGNVDMNLWYADIEGKVAESTQENNKYGLSDFILESRKIFGVSGTASATDILKNTITVSMKKNKSHAIVTPLERYMKSLGYYIGNIEADHGKTPIFGPGMQKAIILYQNHVVGAPKKWQDGELTAGGATWKKLYGAS